MREEARLHMAKARQLLAVAHNLVSDGYDNDAARDSYMVVYHAAQAYIVDHVGKAAKTHNGAQSQFAQLACLEPRISVDLRQFLTTAYTLKAVVDYEFGEGSDIPHDRAQNAVTMAGRFVDCIADLLNFVGPE